MSCKCRKCREKIEEVETYKGSTSRGVEQQSRSTYGYQQRRAADVYGSGSNGYSHINAHNQNERHRSGPVNPYQSVVSAKPASSISDLEPEKRISARSADVELGPEKKLSDRSFNTEPEKKMSIKSECSNSAILETDSNGMTLIPGQVLKFKDGISGSDNCGTIIISANGDTITFKSAGMYRFVLTFAVEDSAPNTIFISSNKSNPDHINFQTLTIYTNGVNICSTILPIKDNTEIKFRHPGGKDKSDIKFIGAVRLELYEV